LLEEEDFPRTERKNVFAVVGQRSFPDSHTWVVLTPTRRHPHFSVCVLSACALTGPELLTPTFCK
jgi:hypothetical protein